ncbi:MAG: acyltransferase [Oricola sp.]
MNARPDNDTAIIAPALPARFHWLDFMRFLAALAVVLHHYYFLYLNGSIRVMSEDAMIALFPFAGMRFFYDYGQYAVQFFWVLSGFVFAHTYFRKPSDGIGFATARFARLYPLHFATLIIVAALQIVSVDMTGVSQITTHNDAYHFVLQLFFVSAWGLQEGDSFNAPIWSVSVEIAAYIVFFLLHCKRLFQTTGGQVLAVFTAIALSSVPGLNTVAACIAFFLAGCLTYTLVRTRRTIDYAIAGMLVLLALRFPDALILFNTPMAVPLATFAVVVFAGAWLDILRLPGGRIAGHLGDFTYSVYLLHTPLIISALIALNATGDTGRVLLGSPVTLAAYLGCLMTAALVCYRCFERPADRAIRAWVKAKRAQAGAAEAEIRAI